GGGGEGGGGERGGEGVGVLGGGGGGFTSQYSRTFVEAAQRIPEIPRMTAARDEALDLLAEMAEELCFEMELRPGDIQLLNNHVIYHARTAFEDDEGTGRDRLLYRRWLSMTHSPALPPGLEVRWGSMEPGALRGGIAQG